MKKNKIYFLLMYCVCLCFMSTFMSCDDNDDYYNQTNLPYLFRPVNFNASMTGTQAVLSWAQVDSAVSYTIEIYKDSLLFQPQNKVVSETVNVRFYQIELAGGTVYSARVRANASNSEMDSKFNDQLTFRTPTENLFNGYSSAMTAQGTADMKWLPKANVTHLLFKASGLADKRVDISAEEIIAGEKVCDGLPNATYTVEIYNNTILRGTTTLVIEGNTFLKEGDNLIEALDAADDGDVIVLDAGATFITSGATYKFSKSVKIKGLSASSRSLICMNSSASATASIFGFTDGAEFNNLSFENLDLSGFAGTSEGATKIGYLFNNNTTMSIQATSFTNCILHNFGNTPMRLQGNKNQLINNLTFDKCIIYDIGFASVYAVVNSNTATDLINNITFKNSTIYNFKGSLILRQNGSLNSILVQNCTINQGMMDDPTVRLLIDCNAATISGSILLSNNILGSTSAVAAGVRPALEKSSISGCYYTSDYKDGGLVGGVAYPITDKMSAYGKSSTDLWTNPTAGNFTFKDATFAGKATAGDPRWK